MHYNELKLWTIRGTCSTHGDYIYRAKKDEKAVGCPVCTVKELTYKLAENQGDEK